MHLFDNQEHMCYIIVIGRARSSEATAVMAMAKSELNLPRVFARGRGSGRLWLDSPVSRLVETQNLREVALVKGFCSSPATAAITG